METFNSTELINIAVKAAVEAESKNNNKLYKQPYFWVLVTLVSYMIISWVVQYIFTHNVMGMYIQVCLQYENDPKIRAFLLRELRHFRRKRGHVVVYEDEDDYDISDYVTKLEKMRKLEEARIIEDTENTPLISERQSILEKCGL